MARAGRESARRMRAVVGLVLAVGRARGAVDMDLRAVVSRERWRDVVASADALAYVVAPEGRARRLAAEAVERVEREIANAFADSIERAPRCAFAIATRETIGARGYRAFEDFFAPARASSSSSSDEDARERDVLIVVHRPDADDERVVRRVSCAIDGERDVDDERSRACVEDVRRALAAALAAALALGQPSLEM